MRNVSISSKLSPSSSYALMTFCRGKPFIVNSCTMAGYSSAAVLIRLVPVDASSKDATAEAADGIDATDAAAGGMLMLLVGAMECACDRKSPSPNDDDDGNLGPPAIFTPPVDGAAATATIGGGLDSPVRCLESPLEEAFACCFKPLVVCEARSDCSNTACSISKYVASASDKFKARWLYIYRMAAIRLMSRNSVTQRSAVQNSAV
mmetsp:Transcript_6771/g.18396  ORF Transcript_6771/g.18396 Transcript_6771/m.18396 type:complete len:206 (+) Transcript_6771:699-1316(+)